MLDEVDGPAGDDRKIELARFCKGEPVDVVEFAAGISDLIGVIVNELFMDHEKPGVETACAIGRGDGSGKEIHVV